VVLEQVELKGFVNNQNSALTVAAENSTSVLNTVTVKMTTGVAVTNANMNVFSAATVWNNREVADLPQFKYLNRGQVMTFPPVFELLRYKGKDIYDYSYPKKALILPSKILSTLNYLRTRTAGKDKESMPNPSQIR